MTTESVEHRYRYLTESRVDTAGSIPQVHLATAGGCAPNPWLADGHVVDAQPAARALLLVADVAGTRFWTPPNMVAAAVAAADPVVTTAPDALRFESFSRCGGVYARFDLDRSAFDGTVADHGTTNVDVNPPLRTALARVGGRDPLRLSVGHDEVAVSTLTGRVVEKRVALPERWVRGFAEVAVAVAAHEPHFELRAAGLRRFLDQLPATAGRGHSWVVPSGGGARLSSRPASGAVAATGIERLRALRRIAPFVRSLTAYGPAGRQAQTDEACSVWSAELDGGRVTITLSPSPSRGFSGEGGLLLASAARDPNDPLDPQPSDGLDRLERAAAGRLGYDVTRAEWFTRELPFDRSALEGSGGRLAAARELVGSGAVHLLGGPDLDGDDVRARVRSGGNEYVVRNTGGAWRCTCPWWGRHGGGRGPCKHVLATVLTHRSAT